MTKKLISKPLAIFFVLSFFAVIGLVNAADTYETTSTTTSVGNTLPVITATPSDGGSHSGAGTGDTDTNPTNVGSNVTFTATGADVNANNYFLAVCKTDVINAGTASATPNPPSCASSSEWAISASTATGVEAEIAYTTLQGDAESNAWYAFVCDDIANASGPPIVASGCYPVTGSGDKGSAVGTVVFADVPADEDNITIDSVTYVFDDGTVASCVIGGTCVDVTSAEDGAGVAAALAAAEAGATSSMTARGATVYIYADTEGDSSIGTTVNTCPNCTIANSTLMGGDDENASPFHVNHKPSFSTVVSGNASGGGGLAYASGTIVPGETVYVSVDASDADTNSAQDTVSIYVCSTNSFTGGAIPACGGTQLCTASGFNPTSAYAECSFSDQTTIPTAHGDYAVYAFIVDNHGVVATDDGTHTYTVADVAPVVGTYTASDVPTPPAGGNDTVTFSVALADNNGDADVDSMNGTFFYEGGNDDGLVSAVDHDCTASENTCYRQIGCTLNDVSSPTAAGTKTSMGQDENLSATCIITVYFNTIDGNWDVQMEAVDTDYNGGVATEFADAGVTLAVPPMQGIDIQEGSIAYSTVSIGGTSDQKTTKMGNVGNTVLDVLLQGTDMGDVGDSNYIQSEQQKFSTSAPFDWDDATAYSLLDTGVPVNNTEAGGCLNVDMAVRTVNTDNTGDTPLYWKIRIPGTQAAGSYTGSNTFTSTTDLGGSCNLEL